MKKELPAIPTAMNITLMLYFSTRNPARREPIPWPTIQQHTEPILMVVAIRYCGAITEEYAMIATKLIDIKNSMAP